MSNQKTEKDMQEKKLIEEIVLEEKKQEEPNFIMEDWRKEIFANEILLFLNFLKSQVKEKTVEVIIKIS